ncbi:hypothetical protein BH11MYX1_BH11MYX1_54390 [soil metagenome]
MLYREVLAATHHINPWSLGYATGVGAFFLPGQSREIYGYIEATMFDVKTGLLMFTTRRAVTAEQHENEWRTDDKLAILAATTVSKFARDLGIDFLVDVRGFANAAVAENAKQRRDPEELVAVPPMAPSIAN